MTHKRLCALLGAFIILVRGWRARPDNGHKVPLGGDNGPLPGWDGVSAEDYDLPDLPADQAKILEGYR